MMVRYGVTWRVLLPLAIIGCTSGPPPASTMKAAIVPADTAAFAPAVFIATDGTRLPYRLLAPAPVVRGRRYPLVLHLHGSGAIGTDNSAQLGAFAAGWAGPSARSRFPAWVLVPQFASRTVEYHPGSRMDGALVSTPLPALAASLELLDSLCRGSAVDTTRVYAAGFSMGGSSVWHALLLRPSVFAAAIAIASVPPDASDLARLPHVPLLLLHGTADTENPYVADRGAYELMPLAHRQFLEFRPYPGLAHEIPPDVLGGDWWREWLFRRDRLLVAEDPPLIVPDSLRAAYLAAGRAVVDSLLASAQDTAPACVSFVQARTHYRAEPADLQRLAAPHRRFVVRTQCPRTYTSMIVTVDSLGRRVNPPPRGYVDPHRVEIMVPGQWTNDRMDVDVRVIQGTRTEKYLCFTRFRAAGPVVSCRHVGTSMS